MTGYLLSREGKTRQVPMGLVCRLTIMKGFASGDLLLDISCSTEPVSTLLDIGLKSIFINDFTLIVLFSI